MTNTNKDLEKKFITVTVEGGNVQNVSDIPQGYAVIVKDYDNGEVGEVEFRDDDGRGYSMDTWEPTLDSEGIPQTTNRQLLLDTLCEAAYWRYRACNDAAKKIRKSKAGALDDVISNTHVVLTEVETNAVLARLNETLE